jgi:hypothetical protein
MEDTCNFEKCKFGQDFFSKPEECFNYKETWWKPLEGEPKLVKDCTPIRTLLMVQNLHDRLIGVQKSQEEQRNKSDKVINAFVYVMEEAQKQINTKNISKKENGGEND